MAKKSDRGTVSQVQRAPIVDVSPSRCRKCESTERTDYSDTQTRVVVAPGVHPVFGIYNRVVLRRTKCKECGQARVDRSYENTVAARMAEKPA